MRTSSPNQPFQRGFRCPWCLTPHHNPWAKDGRLSEPERQLLKENGDLPRVCLACGEVYSLVADIVTVPGVPGDTEINDDFWPRNEKGERTITTTRLPKTAQFNSWVRSIRPLLRDLRDQGMSCTEIAKKLGKPRGRVRKWLKRLGMTRPRRSTGSSRRRSTKS